MTQIAVQNCCQIGQSMEHVHACTICKLWNMEILASWVSKWPESGDRLFLCTGCKSSGAGSADFMLRFVDLDGEEINTHNVV